MVRRRRTRSRCLAWFRGELGGRVGLTLVVHLLLTLAAATAQENFDLAQTLAELQRLDRQTDAQLAAGQTEEARATAGQVVEVRRLLLGAAEELGPDMAEVAGGFRTMLFFSLAKLAEVEEAGGDLEAAEKTRAEQTQVGVKAFPPQSWTVADARAQLAHVQRLRRLTPAQRSQYRQARNGGLALLQRVSQGQSDGAADEALELLDTIEQTAGKEGIEYAEMVGMAGRVYSELRDFAKAAEYYRRGAELTAAVLGDDHPKTAIGWNNLGYALHQEGRLQEAEEHYLHGLRIRDAAFTPTNPASANSLENLAIVCSDRGDYARAEEYALRAEKIYREMEREQEPDYALLQNSLGSIYEGLGRYAEAKDRYGRAAELLLRSAPGHPLLATVLSHLGHVCTELRQHDEALAFHRKAVALAAECFGRSSLDYARLTNNLAYSLAVAGDLAEAEQRYAEVRDIVRAVEGEETPPYAAAVNNLAFVAGRRGNTALVRPLLETALAIREKVFGDQHPDTIQSLQNLGQELARLGQWPEAFGCFDRARQAMRRELAAVLGGFDEATLLDFLNRHERPGLEMAVSLAVQHGDARRVATWLLNGKGLLHEVLAERARLARLASDGECAEMVHRLRAVRTELAGLSLTGAGAGDAEEYRKRLAALRGEEADLSAQIGRRLGRPAADDLWVDLDDLRRRLGDGTVFVDSIRYFALDVTGDTPAWKESRYAALIVPPAGQGDVQLVELGAAEPIDDAIAAARQAIDDAPDRVRAEGEIAAERAVLASLEALSRKLWQPLLPHLGEARRLVVSPDSRLWLVPWCALVMDDGSYAVERYEISLAISGRCRTASLPSEGETGPPVVFAEPDYDVLPADTLAMKTPDSDPMPSDAGRGGGLRHVLDFEPLPNTYDEALAIAPHLETLAGCKPELYLQEEATEGRFAAIARPEILVLSTHGFFLDGPAWSPPDPAALLAAADRPPSARDPDLAADAMLQLNPLLRCGLALAGANLRQPQAGTSRDGVLTGMEILDADLRGTRLVVLSACETGLGELRSAEGVASLQQAFQSAGAGEVVATLWPIDDRETQPLMAAFFAEMAAGKQPAAALRAAQLQRIEKRRSRYSAANPFWWAAFTANGSVN